MSYGYYYYIYSSGHLIFCNKITPCVRKSNPQSLNQYAYCNNNPINNVDPNGDSWFTVAINTIVSNVTSAIVSHSTSKAATVTHSGGDMVNRTWTGEGTSGRLGVAGITGSTLVSYDGNIIDLLFSKIRHSQPDSGLKNLSDDEVSRRVRDKSLSGQERRRYQAEEKYRKMRNKQKRMNFDYESPGSFFITPDIIYPDFYMTDFVFAL